MPHDDGLRLGPDLAGIVERCQSDLLAGQVGSCDLVTASLEFLGEPVEAPAAVPPSVHEHKPCHQASIHHSTRCSGSHSWPGPPCGNVTRTRTPNQARTC